MRKRDPFKGSEALEAGEGFFEEAAESNEGFFEETSQEAAFDTPAAVPEPEPFAEVSAPPERPLVSVVVPASAAIRSKRLSIEKIRADGGTQVRAELIDTRIATYADEMREGAQFPPIVVFYDGSAYWLADGFHRLRAHLANGQAKIDAEIRPGTVRDAILYSVGCNTNHGLRRKNEDKRAAVLRLLNDEEWSQWSDHEIARRCAVSQPFVGALRNGIASANVIGYVISSDPASSNVIGTEPAVPSVEPQADPAASANVFSSARRCVRKGTVYSMNTEKIGTAPTPGNPDWKAPLQTARAHVSKAVSRMRLTSDDGLEAVEAILGVLDGLLRQTV